MKLYNKIILFNHVFPISIKILIIATKTVT